jgi:periplasmic divalent cation tolerance protein
MGDSDRFAKFTPGGQSMTEYIQITTVTANQKEAENIAQSLLETRLAGCIQIYGPISSTYWWQGTIESAQEWLCQIKTSRQLYPQIEAIIRSLHSYKVPEILALPVIDGNPDYLKWLDGELVKT